GNSVYAFNPSDGSQLWHVHLPGATAQPAVANGRVYVSTEHGANDAFLHALDAATGNEVWKSPKAVGHFGDALSRAAIDTGGNAPPNVFVASQDGYIYAFALSDGWFAWKRQISESEAWPIDPTW